MPVPLNTIAPSALAVIIAAVPASTTRTVKIGDNYFVRPTGVPTVTVAKGQRVTWKWTGRSAHNVHATRGPMTFSSPTKRTGTYSRIMTRRGSYTLICDIHGARDQQMKLVVH